MEVEKVVDFAAERTESGSPKANGEMKKPQAVDERKKKGIDSLKKILGEKQ
jgi:predicted flap endonuclease-1-like 5' DNA nuclease